MARGPCFTLVEVLRPRSRHVKGTRGFQGLQATFTELPPATRHGVDVDSMDGLKGKSGFNPQKGQSCGFVRFQD